MAAQYARYGETSYESQMYLMQQQQQYYAALLEGAYYGCGMNTDSAEHLDPEAIWNGTSGLSSLDYMDPPHKLAGSSLDYMYPTHKLAAELSALRLYADLEKGGDHVKPAPGLEVADLGASFPQGLLLQLAASGLDLPAANAKAAQQELQALEPMNVQTLSGVGKTGKTKGCDRLTRSGPGKGMFASTHNEVELPWPIVRQLGESLTGRVLAVSPINALGIESADVLWEHFSKYGCVAKVLVAHGDEDDSNAPGSTGDVPGVAAIVMMSEADADRAVADGSSFINGQFVTSSKFRGPLVANQPSLAHFMANHFNLASEVAVANQQLGTSSSSQKSTTQAWSGSGSNSPGDGSSASACTSKSGRQTKAAGQFKELSTTTSLSTPRTGSPGPCGSSGSEGARWQ